MIDSLDLGSVKQRAKTSNLKEMSSEAKREVARIRYENLLSKLSISDKAIVDSIPQRYKTLIVKTMLGECSWRMAVKAKCISCVAYENVQDEIANCGARRCPLHEFRPYKETA